MSSNRPPIQLPPTIITPEPRPPLPPLATPPPSLPGYQIKFEKILPLDSFGNLPFESFDERYANTMAAAMLLRIREMQQGYERARAAVAKNADATLASAGFKSGAADNDAAQLEINQAVLNAAISATQTQIPLERALARQFFNGADPHTFGGVQAFNYLYKTKQLYGRGVANRSYRAWIAAYQAQYEAVLLEAQLVYLQQQQTELSKKLEAAEKARMAYRSPALQATSTPMVLGRAGALSVSSTARLTLVAAIEAAVARVSAAAAASLGASVAVFAGMVYSSKLGDGSRFPTTVPLDDLYTGNEDLHALASAKGELNLPVRLGMSTDEEQILFYAVATGFVPGNVRVRQATYAPATGNYSFTTDDVPTQTLIWTPVVRPGDSSTESPITDLPTPDYSGPVVAPVDPYIETFPSVAEGGFDDYIIVFPADSGLDPIYVMFKDRRE